MEQSGGYQNIIEKLYTLYLEKGFLREDEALALLTAENVTLVAINRITNRLLELGVYFGDDTTPDDDDIDRTQTNYDLIFSEILEISPGQSYFINYIKNIRPPQHREWRNLMPQAKNGNEYAINRLIDMYLRVVVKIALSSYKNEGYELDDLIQEGALGLRRAIENYDFTKHGSFVSYLPLWIKQYIDRAIADKSRVIRIPVHFHEHIKNVKRTVNEIQRISNAEPSVEQVADKLNMTVREVERVLELSSEIIPLEMLKSKTNRRLYRNNLIAPEDEMPHERFILHEAKIKLREALSTLTSREQIVMLMRYGLDDGEFKTLEEVGISVGVTRERIRQIEEKALRKLRHPTRQKYLRDFY